jgi:hypothetical protein
MEQGKQAHMSVSIQGSVSKGWLHEQAGFVFDRDYYLDPMHRFEQDRQMHAFIKMRFPDLPIYNMEASLVQAHCVKQDQILIGGIQPNLILGAALGAKLVFYPDRDADIDAAPLQELSHPDELPSVDSVLTHPFMLALDETLGQMRQTHPGRTIVPPLFWDSSGRATLHGILTTAHKLMGERVFMLCMTDPEFLHGVHQWVTDAYVALVRHYAHLGGTSVSSVHVGECSGVMVSGQQYQEFVTPYISQIGRALGPVRLHSCGRSDHLLAALAKIANLTVVDVGSGTSLARIRALLGEDLEINVFPPVELLLDGSASSNIRDWLGRTLADNCAGPLSLAYHLEPGYDIENCLALHEALEAQGFKPNKRLY